MEATITELRQKLDSEKERLARLAEQNEPLERQDELALVQQRVRKVKHMVQIAGVGTFEYYCAQFLGGTVNLLIPIAVTLIVATATDVSGCWPSPAVRRCFSVPSLPPPLPTGRCPSAQR